MATYHIDNLLGNNTNAGTSAGAGAWADARGPVVSGTTFVAGDILMIKATGTDYDYGTIATAENITGATVPIFVTRETGDTTRPKQKWLKSSTGTPSFASSGNGTLSVFYDQVDFEFGYTTGSNANPAGALNAQAGGNVNISNSIINLTTTLSATGNFYFTTSSPTAAVVITDNVEINFNNKNVVFNCSPDSMFLNSKFYGMNDYTTTSASGSFPAATYKRCFIQGDFINASADQFLFGAFTTDTALVFENNNLCIKNSSNTSGQKNFFPALTTSTLPFIKDNIFVNETARTNINIFPSGTNGYKYFIGNNATYQVNRFGTTPTNVNYGFGNNYTLSANPYISTTQGNANFLKVNNTTADAIANIVRKAWQNANGDIGAEIFAIIGSSPLTFNQKIQSKNISEEIRIKMPRNKYDTMLVALSSGDTVETYTFKLSGATVATLTATFASSTRQTPTSLVWS